MTSARGPVGLLVVASFWILMGFLVLGSQGWAEPKDPAKRLCKGPA